MPATVQAILAARIDRLAPEAKRQLQEAAVIGKDVPLAVLVAIADAPEHKVRAELTRLQAAEFLYEVRLFPDLEYTFKHALTHEAGLPGPAAGPAAGAPRPHHRGHRAALKRPHRRAVRA